MKFFIIFPITMLCALFLQRKHVIETISREQGMLFSFGVFTDAQYCDCDPMETRFYRNSMPKLREAFVSFIEENVGFVVNLGDIIEKDYSSFAPPLDLIKESSLKVYHVAGNHDFSVVPRFKKRVIPLLSGKSGYYSFSVGYFRFIVLDGNEISIYGPGNRNAVRQAEAMAEKLKNDGEQNFHDWNGGISSTQLSWLRKQLEESLVREEKVFILCHFPAWPENEHNLYNYREVVSLLENQNNIIAWFSGHNHTGNYGNRTNIHFYNFKGMVETENLNSYAIVEVYRNRIWIKGFGREKSMILAY